MNFFEQPASKQWAILKYRGEKFAEVWFKPDGEPLGLIFRIPRENFHIPGMGQQLTLENLLRAVGLSAAEVDSWRHGDVSHSGMDGANPAFKIAVPPPTEEVRHLDVHVRVNPPSQADDAVSPAAPEFSPAQWQDLEGRWKAILILEAAMDALRISMESLHTEMDNAYRKSLTMEEKTYALRADIAAWDKAKKRVQFALPKMKDFIHRAVWAVGSAERKRLEEIYKAHIQPQVPFADLDQVLKQLEDLQKDRQVLSAIGKTIYQDCKGLSAEIQGALRTLQSNAAGRKKGAKGRFFKG